MFAIPVTWIGFVLFQGSLILFFTLLVWLAARRLSAATRHCVLLAGLLAVTVIFIGQTVSHQMESDVAFMNIDSEKLDIDREIIHYLPRMFSSQDLLKSGDTFDTLEKYKLKLPNKDEATIAVLDGEGNVLGTENISDVKSGMDKARELLKLHLPDRKNAREMYKAAQETAKREGKKVIFMVGGPRCGPCFRLNEWYETQRGIMEKDYVLFKYHRLRHDESIELTTEVRGEDGGIPWFAIQDADGNSLATSDGPNGNIGFPSSETGIAHLMRMLAKTRTQITDEELTALRNSLGGMTSSNQPDDDPLEIEKGMKADELSRKKNR